MNSVNGSHEHTRQENANHGVVEMRQRSGNNLITAYLTELL